MPRFIAQVNLVQFKLPSAWPSRVKVGLFFSDHQQVISLVIVVALRHLAVMTRFYICLQVLATGADPGRVGRAMRQSASYIGVGTPGCVLTNTDAVIQVGWSVGRHSYC